MGVEMIQAGCLSILPPVIAIVLALITKEVFSALLAGIFSGMVIYCFSTGQSIVAAVNYVFQMMASKIADHGYMLIFLALLGGLVIVVTKAGGSKAYGKWASQRLKSPVSAKLATAILGMLIFIDDYFNCLTVGTVMRPITDKHRIAREKLAYIIDSTAAPICILAPISSWAVAVSSELGSVGGFQAFLQVIPYNFYAWLTLIMVIFICVTNFDFGPMKRAVEAAAMEEYEKEQLEQEEIMEVSDKGSTWDLVIPMLVLIACSILGMAYVGGFFEGAAFSEAIGVHPTAGLTLGAFAALIVAMMMYLASLSMLLSFSILSIYFQYSFPGIQNVFQQFCRAVGNMPRTVCLKLLPRTESPGYAYGPDSCVPAGLHVHIGVPDIYHILLLYVPCGIHGLADDFR